MEWPRDIGRPHLMLAAELHMGRLEGGRPVWGLGLGLQMVGGEMKEWKRLWKVGI